LKEYKGHGGNVTIEGEKIFIKLMFQKENCTIVDITRINFIQPGMLTNGSIEIITKKGTYKIFFLKKSIDEFKELYDLINEKIHSVRNDYTSINDSNDDVNKSLRKKNNEENRILRTSSDMYQYCIDNNYGQGMSKSWGLKHFQLIENSISTDEKILMCFIGLHNYISMSKHDFNFAYAITNKRVIMAQKKIVGEIIQTVSLKNLNDITLVTGMSMGTITIDTIKETFNIGVDKSSARSINDKIHELLLQVQDSKTNSTVYQKNLEPTYSVADEILKFKNLLDLGAISQEEFDLKKKQILSV